MKKYIFVIILLFSIFLAPAALAQSIPGINDITGGGNSSSAPRGLEIEYPSFPSAAAPTTTTVGLPNYVKYIYYFAIMISGIIALVVLVIGGLQYVGSIGSPDKLNDAKERMFSALIGLFILICSGLILRTINPTLVVFKNPNELYSILPGMSPGVYMCKDRVNITGFWGMGNQEGNASNKEAAKQMNDILKEIKEKCTTVSSAGDVPQNLDGQIKFVYLVPLKDEIAYGVIVYEDTGFNGKASVIFGDTKGSVGDAGQPTEWSLPGGLSPSSAKPFTLIKNPPAGYKATMYELVHFNRDDKEGKKQKQECQISKTSQECQVTKEIGSTEIIGNAFVVFFKDGGTANWSLESEIDVISAPGDNNLNDNLMGKWKPNECVEKREPKWRDRYYPCATSAVAIAANFY